MIINSPIGLIKCICQAHVIEQINLLGDIKSRLSPPQTEFETQVAKAIEHYFVDPNTSFNLPLAQAPSPFQQQIRQALLAIPVGETITYGALAEKLDSHPRAVGQACRANPIPLIVPCHRVVAKADLGGFMGKADPAKLSIKLRLLQLEQSASAVTQ